MTMLRGILFRFLSRLALLAVVGTLVFMIQLLIPGDPAELLLSSAGSAPTQENIERLRERMGLNLPILEQYWRFIAATAQLNFGSSLIDGSNIGQIVAMRLPRTLELVFTAMFLAIAIAVPLGTNAALRAGKRLDAIGSAVSALLAAVPVFVIGTLLILLFSQTLGMLPAGGYIDFSLSPVEHSLNLLLPAVTVALSLIPIVYRMTRASVLESLSNEWVRTAVAKGLPRAKVIRHHVLRNSLGPVVTVVGLQLGVLIGSTVLIEFVFNWPGLSGFLITAVEQRDYPSVRAVVLVVAALFIFINFLVELLQGLLDPRG